MPLVIEYERALRSREFVAQLEQLVRGCMHARMPAVLRDSFERTTELRNGWHDIEPLPEVEARATDAGFMQLEQIRVAQAVVDYGDAVVANPVVHPVCTLPE